MLTRRSSHPLASSHGQGGVRPQTLVRRNVLATCLPAEKSGKAKAKNSNSAPLIVLKVSGDMHVNVGQDAQAVEWDAVALSPEAKALLQKHVEAGAALKLHRVLGFEDAGDVQRLTPDLIAQLNLKLDTLLHMLQQHELGLAPQPLQLQPQQLHGSKEDKGLDMEEQRLQQQEPQQQQQQQEEQQLKEQQQKEQQQLQQQQQHAAVQVAELIKRIGKCGYWAITPDGHRAVSTNADNALEVWDPATGTLIATVARNERVILPVANSSDGPTGGCDFTLRVWGHAYAASMDRKSSRALCVAISPDGRYAVSGGADNAVWVWDLEAYACIGVIGALRQHSYSVRTVAITPDGRRVVSGSEDNTLRVWDLATRTSIATLKGHRGPVLCVAITPDGRHAVSGGLDCMLHIWDLDTHTCVATMQGHAGWVFCVAITPDGRHAVSAGSDTTLHLWDLATHACVGTKEGHQSPITSVFITPDGRHAAFTTSNKTVDKWDLAAYLDAAAVK